MTTTETIENPLHPLPHRLAKLLINGDRNLAAKCEAYMNAHSDGRYPFLRLWLDDEGNLDERIRLGTKVCEIIESGNIAELES